MMLTLRLLLFGALAIGLSNVAAQAAIDLVVLPQSFTLTGQAAQQSMIVEMRRGEDFVGETTGKFEWSSSDPKIVAIKDGVAVPAGNGTAKITAKVGSQTASAEVTVAGKDRPIDVSFRNQVQSVLAKSGCNSGACHGAAAGKNGFKLSLRGYDADADWFTITRQARGRRIVPSDPGRSLLLLKPTGALPHKGGVRFEVDSPDYNTIAAWIAAGAPAPKESDPRLDRLEMLPAAVVLKPGDSQRLLVRAYYSDGHSDDVTHGVKFTSSDESVAQVDQSGRVKIMGSGEGVVSGWFASRIVVATITVPFTQPVAAEALDKVPRRNLIDGLVLAKLKRLNLPPSPRASDAEFLRRAFIDTIGVLPTADETRAFLADSARDKRDRLIDALLARPEFVDYWTYKWSDLLLVNSEKLPAPAMWSYYRWIRSQVAENTPWDQFARRIVTASGSTLENGAANFYALHKDPLEMSETASQAFLGMSITCAHCHNHPLEKWTNDQYYGMANLFARLKIKNADGEGNLTVFPTTEGELIQPRTGRPQPPRPLDGEAIPLEATADRRLALADWLTAPENPYFSRAITNRVWANFLGVGLVEAVDDVRLTNPPSNAELLSALAKHLVENHYDLKSLMRLILQSETYQRSSQTLAENAADRRFYSRYFPRRMRAEVLLDAISQVTGTPTEFKGYAPGWRALQLPDSNVDSYFLKSFGRPQRLLTCECERTNEPSMVQVLHISNGDTINQKLAAKGSRVEQLLAAKTPDDKIIEDAYLSALSRLPTDVEKQQLVSELGQAPAAEKRQAVEDLYWSLLSGKEFLFNH
jgi:Protein of unknown function (DUF1553)/Protein of unknown function (DUF1549)/Bacterial Ig-like domain (group 2)